MPSDVRERLNRLITAKRNPGLAVFRSLEGLEGIAKQVAESVVRNHLEAIKKDIGEELRFILKEFIGEDEVVRLKGDDGKTPVAGKDFLTPEEMEQISQDILRRATPIKGVHFNDGREGPVGLQGLPGEKGLRGLPGKAVAGPPGLRGFAGKDGSPDTAVQVRDKLQSLRGEQRLDAAFIKNLDFWIKGFGRRTLHRGGVFARFSDLTPETNGSTRVFTVPTHQSDSVMLVSSSFPFVYRPTTDYTTSGTTLTIDSSLQAPVQGTTLIFYYAP